MRKKRKSNCRSYSRSQRHQRRRQADAAYKPIIRYRHVVPAGSSLRHKRARLNHVPAWVYFTAKLIIPNFVALIDWRTLFGRHKSDADERAAAMLW